MNPMILGEQILLGVMVLEGLDLMVDCNRNRLVPLSGHLGPARLSRLGCPTRLLSMVSRTARAPHLCPSATCRTAFPTNVLSRSWRATWPICVQGASTDDGRLELASGNQASQMRQPNRGRFLRQFLKQDKAIQRRPTGSGETV